MSSKEYEMYAALTRGQCEIVNAITRIADILVEMSATDTVPVRYGKWMLEQEKSDGYGNWNRWSCSCCGYVRTKGWAATSEGHKPQARFCENCGAKMDERKEDKYSGQDDTNTRAKREPEPLPYNHPHCSEEGYKHLACTYPVCDMSCPVQQDRMKKELERIGLK